MVAAMNEIAITYKVLALAFNSPTEQLVDALRATEFFGAALPEHADVESLLREHTRVFSLTVAGGVAPYQLEYGDPGAFSKTQRMADIAGFHKAFGVELMAQERVDHIGAELELMHWLVSKEQRGVEAGRDEQVQVCRDAATKFMDEHLGRWAPFFAELLTLAARHPFYEALGEALGEFIDQECKRLGVAPDVITMPVPPSCGAKFDCQLEKEEAATDVRK
jgi:TorA maturation chaperone TorD